MFVWSVFVFIVAVCGVFGKPSTRRDDNPLDAIGFPEPEEDQRLKNKDGRVPVYIPAMCSPNELLYPGDQKDDWICDCRPAYIFHPATDACWPAWEQGPCEKGQYLVLAKGAVKPECKKNPCNNSGYVMVDGQCVVLGSTEPCTHMLHTPAAMGVNSTTLEVGCVRLTAIIQLRFASEPEKIMDRTCLPGCKRILQEKCTNVTVST